jgi:hypothetical protein
MRNTFRLFVAVAALGLASEQSASAHSSPFRLAG